MKVTFEIEEFINTNDMRIIADVFEKYGHEQGGLHFTCIGINEDVPAIQFHTKE